MNRRLIALAGGTALPSDIRGHASPLDLLTEPERPRRVRACVSGVPPGQAEALLGRPGTTVPSVALPDEDLGPRADRRPARRQRSATATAQIISVAAVTLLLIAVAGGVIAGLVRPRLGARAVRLRLQRPWLLGLGAAINLASLAVGDDLAVVAVGASLVSLLAFALANPPITGIEVGGLRSE